MPGGGEPVGGGVQATDDGIGTLLPGATEGTDTVQGVQGGDGGWVFGREQDYTAWVSISVCGHCMADFSTFQ